MTNLYFYRLYLIFFILLALHRIDRLVSTFGGRSKNPGGEKLDARCLPRWCRRRTATPSMTTT